MSMLVVPTGPRAFADQPCAANIGDVFIMPAGMIDKGAGDLAARDGSDFRVGGSVIDPGCADGATFCDEAVDIARNAQAVFAGALCPTPENFAALTPRRHCA